MRGAWVLAFLSMVLAPSLARGQTVEARVDRSRVVVGETTTLRVIVRGANGAKAPDFDVPTGLRLAGSSRQQSFAWVNGRASVENEFLYDLVAADVGHYEIGPIVVTVGSQYFRSGLIVVDVSAAPPALPEGHETPATLRVEVQPRDPYVGQECVLRVRLIQRASFAEDPQYTPPTTTGFWTDRPTAPESYYADDRGERVLVTETRTRLYPLAIGPAIVGDAAAVVVVAQNGGGDPFGTFGDRQEMVLRSPPVNVNVRSLPSGAPPGFGGAVGRYEATWGVDRTRTPRDVPVTLHLDVRGRGNLPLVRAPLLVDPDIEVLANSVEDSLPTPGSDGPGRKRFQWTVMPNREGRIEIPFPAFAWFDPTAGGYRSSSGSLVKLDVDPAISTAGSNPDAAFPRALSDRPAHPGSRGPVPWGFALAGIALGAAVRLWRGRPRTPATVAEARAWSLRLRAIVGADFWKVAEDAAQWLETHATTRDTAWAEWRKRIASARYGGATADADTVRRELQSRLGRLQGGSKGFSPRLAAVGCAVLSIAAMVFFGPRPGSPRAAAQSLLADQAARRGEIAKARSAWVALWRVHGGDPGLAARLAWAHDQAGEVGRAALWVLRGELVEARDPGLRWVEERVREGGGLIGAGAPRWPVRRLEWSIGVFALGLIGMIGWDRRSLALSCLALAVAGSAVEPIQSWRALRSGEAVVVSAAGLQGSDVELEPGQLVIVRGREGDRVRVAAGRVVEGWVPAASVAQVTAPPEGEG
jgi:hypothetical protein